MSNLVVAELFEPLVQPLNSSVIFAKETDIVLTTGAWHIAITINTSTYQDVISTVREDLLLVEQHKQEFTPTSELSHIETLLQQLELKLGSFHEILPRLDRRRGLFNIGGSLLKTIFGTATTFDTDQLRETFDKLQLQNSDIVHSLNNQVTLVKKLSLAAEVNADTVMNLTSIVKDNVVQSHEKFSQIARDLMWFNITVHAQSELFTTIRQLEFALLRLSQQLDELTTVVQCAISGTLPINFITPTVLLGILKNVSLQLHRGYELIAGIRIENIHLYYELIKTSIVASPHSIKLMLHVPLKSKEQSFTLYKMIILPERISSGQFIQYSVDHAYFGLNDNQRDYILLTEAQFNYCTKGSIVMCPASIAIYHNQMLTCEESLFFQNTNHHQLCQRKLLLQHQTPILQQHGALWAYFFPEQQTVTLRCLNNENQPTRTLSLHGPGLIHNLSTCYITSTNLRTLPELTGLQQAKLEPPNIYLPNNASAITNYDVHQLENILPVDTARIDYIASQQKERRRTFDVDSLFHVHETTQQHEQRTQRLVILTTTICITIILGILCFTLYSHCLKLRCYSFSNTSNPEPSPEAPAPSTECTPRDTSEQSHSNAGKQDVLFAAYAMQTAK